MGGESGLVEVARFDADSDQSFTNGWQFDFVDGAEWLSVQAETSRSAEGLNEWLWIARLMQEGVTGPTIRPIEVLGTPGLILDHGLSLEDDEVIWADDGFAYRMVFSRRDGNTDRSETASTEVGRLRLAERSDWVNAVIQAEQSTPAESIAVVIAMLTLAAIVVSGIYFAVRRSLWAAGICVSAVLGAVFFLSPGLSPVLVLLAGLGFAWWTHRRSDSLS